MVVDHATLDSAGSEPRAAFPRLGAVAATENPTNPNIKKAGPRRDPALSLLPTESNYQFTRIPNRITRGATIA
jgi:hypothetical protein